MADFCMPSLGADMRSGILVSWRVEAGDQIKKGDIIAEIETEKGLFEIEVYETGVVSQLLVQPGESQIAVGTPLAKIDSTEETTAQKPNKVDEVRPRISPAARLLAEETGVDLEQVRGTGPQGSIVLTDIEQAAGMTVPQPPVEEVHQPKEAGGLRAGMRQAIAAAMSRSNRDIPHYYLATDIDMSRALRWLEETNRSRPIKERLLPVVLPLKAVAKALEKVPQLNGHWIDDQLQVQSAVHIGFAIALRNGGLVTPALMDVERLTLAQLMAALSDLIRRTRSGRLRGSEMTAAGITVTSIGDLGVQTVYGVIYPPQVALVGLGRISERPCIESGQVVARPLLTATLAADHRAGDGHQGAQFLEAFNRALQEPETL